MFKMSSIIRLLLALPVFISLLAGCASLGDLVNPQPSASTQSPDSPVSSDDQPVGGTSTSPLDPIPGEETMKRGEATIAESDVSPLRDEEREDIKQAKREFKKGKHRSGKVFGRVF